MPEYDSENGGKVLSSRWSYARQEKIARLAELRLGHPPVPGPHHGSVVAALDAEGDSEAADALRDLTPPRAPGTRPITFAPEEVGPIVRAGLGVEVAEELRRPFSEATPAEFVAHFGRMGLRVGPGQRRETTLCLYRNSDYVAALHRLLRVPAPEVRVFLRSVRKPDTFLSADAIKQEIAANLSALQPAAEGLSRLESLRARTETRRRRVGK